jgi:acyl dehydratase
MTSAGPQILRLSFPSSALDVLRYAAACGDFHALHHDVESSEAREAGGRVLPGRYQHGACARLLGEALGGTLEELDCNYLSPAYVDSTIELEARVRSADGLQQVRFKLVDAEGRMVLAGRARIRPAPAASHG